MELVERGLGAEQIYVSMERNMKCAVGFCGHCQFGPTFVCKDGPVMRYDRLAHWIGVREV
jgi:NAD(P)H-flavin reductase